MSKPHRANGGSGADGKRRTWGLLAEFHSAQEVFHAAEECRDAGFRHWDVHTPFPIHGMNNAMGGSGTRSCRSSCSGAGSPGWGSPSSCSGG
ncbi:MAG: DUF3341 domain-containing protein [Candidatus Eisenbacteria bacterium]|nr:DUF3341 domain-containing protein [Candidatus Eisenbacteria bacterium]